MNSPRDLRRRIKSISGTAQITKAMQMVAASKMRKAQQAAIDARAVCAAAVPHAAQRDHAAVDFTHPLLEVRAVRRRAVILVAGDKGLCGALNTNVFRARRAVRSGDRPSSSPPAGRRHSSSPARGRQLAAEFAYGDSPTYAEARAIAAFARDLFLKKKSTKCVIVATRFVNTLTQEAVTMEYLPVGEIKGLKVAGAEPEAALAADKAETVFEPSAEDVLSYLLGHYLNIYMYYVLLNAKASEQSARMVSMKSATDSAESLIKDLTLEYNKLRQGNITRELLEIAGGQAG